MSEPIESERAFYERRWLWGLYAAGIVLVLGYAASLRFSLPQTPIIDPDYWGYLNPGVSKLAGGEFKHTFGRNFVYPGFLFLLLRVFGDYRSICIGQHVLGLLTGMLLAGAWNVFCGFLAGPARARMGARFLGLLLVADFVLTRSPLVFEHTVRPEAVFPFFLALCFLLNLGALHAGFIVPRPRLERWCLGLNFFVVGVAQSLKPSLGFGIVAANLPLAFYLLRRGESWRVKSIVVVAAVGLTALTLWLPERLLASSDPASSTFLPTTLFTVHAKFMHTQIVDDLRTGEIAPYPRDWLERFNHQLEASLDTASHPDQSPYRTLGFNPDYLLYVDPVFSPAFPPSAQQEMAAFCMHYYLRAWLHQPVPMLGKLGTQLAEVYHFPLKLRKKHRLHDFFAIYRSNSPFPLSTSYQNALTCCQERRRVAKMLATSGGGAYLESVETLGNTNVIVLEPEWVNFLNGLLTRWHLPLLVMTLIIGILLARQSGRISLPLVAGVWLFWSVDFMMFLTVGIVHSLEPNRYVENQRVCTVFGEFVALLLAWQGVTLLLNQMPGRQSKRLPA